jgi:hypothetical protein
MNKPITTHAIRTQRDYSLGFKLQVVAAVEKGDTTYKQTQNNYGRSIVLS